MLSCAYRLSPSMHLSNVHGVAQVLLVTPEESAPEEPSDPSFEGHTLCTLQYNTLDLFDERVSTARQTLARYYPRLSVDIAKPPSPRIGHSMTMVNIGIPSHSPDGQRVGSDPALLGALVLG